MHCHILAQGHLSIGSLSLVCPDTNTYVWTPRRCVVSASCTVLWQQVRVVGRLVADAVNRSRLGQRVTEVDPMQQSCADMRSCWTDFGSEQTRDADDVGADNVKQPEDKDDFWIMAGDYIHASALTWRHRYTPRADAELLVAQSHNGTSPST